MAAEPDADYRTLGRRASPRRPAAAVSDAMMPGMDGKASGRALRAEPALANLPLVRANTKGDEQDRQDGLALAGGHVGTPSKMAELMLREQRRTRSTVPTGAPAPEAGDEDECAALPEVDRVLLARLEALLEEHRATSRVTTARRAKGLALGPRPLRRETARSRGMSPTEATREHPLTAAQQKLREGPFATIGDVSAATGSSRAPVTRGDATWPGRPRREELRAD